MLILGQKRVKKCHFKPKRPDWVVFWQKSHFWTPELPIGTPNCNPDPNWGVPRLQSGGGPPPSIGLPIARDPQKAAHLLYPSQYRPPKRAYLGGRRPLLGPKVTFLGSNPIENGKPASETGFSINSGPLFDPPDCQSGPQLGGGPPPFSINWGPRLQSGPPKATFWLILDFFYQF